MPTQILLSCVPQGPKNQHDQNWIYGSLSQFCTIIGTSIFVKSSQKLHSNIPIKLRILNMNMENRSHYFLCTPN